jgi:hypothetical protein
MMKRILTACAAVIIAAACSAPALEEIQRPEEPEKPVVCEKATIPFSLTVTTEGTRVSYEEGTYQFKAGDKIHVQGKTRTDLEGYLTQNGEVWSGDLSYEGDQPAATTPLAITLVHADNTDVSTYAKAIVGSAPEGSSLLREAVEHYSLFTADNVTLGSTSAVLYQQATFLDVTVEFDFDGSHIIDAGKALVDLKTTQGEVTEETDFYEKPNTNGEDFYVHFMAVIPGNQKVKDFSLTVGDRPITFTDTDKDLPRNKKFTVNRTIAFHPQVGDPFWSDGTYGRLRHPDSEEHIVGIVVYVNKGGDIADAITEKRTEANGKQLFGHGLVMALTNAAVDVKWSEAGGKIQCTGETITKPEQTLSSNTLSGYSNTESIITALTNAGAVSGSAALLAKNYTYNGFSVSTTSTTGWFLPSIGQWMYTISEDGFGGADPASDWTNGNGVRWLESPEYPLSGDLGDLIYVKECTDSKLNVLVSSLNDRLAQFQQEFQVTYDPFGDPSTTNNVSDNYWTSSEKNASDAIRMNLGSVKQRSGKYYSTIKVKGEEKTKVTVYTEGGVNYKMKVRPFLAF